MSFTPDADIQLAVRQNDSRKVRLTILDKIILKVPSTDDIRALISWVMNNQRPDGGLIGRRNDNSFSYEADKAKWSDEYFQDQVADANDDFCFDRLNHILDVRQHLRGADGAVKAGLSSAHAGVTNPRDPSSPRGGNIDRNGSQSASRFQGGVFTAIGVAFGIASVACFIKGSPLIGFGAAVLGGGCLFAAASKRSPFQ